MCRLMRASFFAVLALSVFWTQQAVATPCRVYNESVTPLDVRFTDQFGNVARVVVAPLASADVLPPVPGLTPGVQHLVALDPGGNALVDRMITVPWQGALLVWVPSGFVQPVQMLPPFTAQVGAGTLPSYLVMGVVALTVEPSLTTNGSILHRPLYRRPTPSCGRAR